MAAFYCICWNGFTISSSIWDLLHQAARQQNVDGAKICGIFFGRLLCPPWQAHHPLLDQHIYSCQSSSNHIMVKVIETNFLWLVSISYAICFSSFIIPPDLMPGRMSLLITILLMLINISGRAHGNTPSSDTFSMIDLWILICIIFVTLALFEYGLVIKIKYSQRGPTAQVHVLEGGRNWTKVTRN